MYHILFIHSSVDGHVGCFYVLAIVNSAAMNIGMHISFQTMVSLDICPGGGITGSYGSSIFSLLRHLLTVLPMNSMKIQKDTTLKMNPRGQ